MRTNIHSCILLLGTLYVLSISRGCVHNEPKPNIIFIMADDLGWFDTGFNGNDVIRTPNLDRLASLGIVLDRFYSASAVCSPTRASVITGRNPLRMDIPTANAGHMRDEEVTLPEILSDAGYRTAHFGKWHLGTLTRLTRDANRGGKKEQEPHFSIPTMHGYDEFFCTESKVPTFDPMLKPSRFTQEESLRFGWAAISLNEPAESYGTAYWKGTEMKDTANLYGDDSRVIMDRLIPFIKSSFEEGDPFFATLWFHTPHLPVVADSALRDPYKDLPLQEQLYYGTITGMDMQIGRLWAHLEDLGIQNETMIWFCSDNGPENLTPGSAGVFRERKRSLYEGGVRVPAFVVWKGHLREGIRLDFPAVTSDYLPTLLDILELDPPDDRPLDGESLFMLLKGEKEEREKEIGFLFREKISWVGNRYKLISTDRGETFELYDLAADRAEMENIIQREPEIARTMESRLREWMQSVEKSKNGADY